MSDDGIQVMLTTRCVEPDHGDIAVVVHAYNAGQQGCFRGIFFPTILQLLLAGFCLLIASTASLGDDIFKPTGRYAAPTKQHYLVSESWCINCPPVKDRFIANGWPESNVMTNAECIQRFGFGVPHVPYEFEHEPPKPQAVIQPAARVIQGVQFKQYVPQRRGIFGRWRR